MKKYTLLVLVESVLMARVVIEVPEEMATLIEQDPLLRLAVAEAVKKRSQNIYSPL